MPKQTYINSTTILFWFTRAKAEGYYTFNIISPYCSVFVFVAVKNIYSCNFVYIMAKPKTQFIQWGTNGYQKSNAMNKFVICMIYIPIFKRLHTFVRWICQMYDMKQCDSLDIKSWTWDVLDWMWGIENAYLTPFKKMACEIFRSLLSICVAYKFAW